MFDTSVEVSAKPVPQGQKDMTQSSEGETIMSNVTTVNTEIKARQFAQVKDQIGNQEVLNSDDENDDSTNPTPGNQEENKAAQQKAANRLSVVPETDQNEKDEEIDNLKEKISKAKTEVEERDTVIREKDRDIDELRKKIQYLEQCETNGLSEPQRMVMTQLIEIYPDRDFQSNLSLVKQQVQPELNCTLEFILAAQ